MSGTCVTCGRAPITIPTARTIAYPECVYASMPMARGYIHERLNIGGSGDGEVFAPEAIEAVYRYARGIPRVTNLLCEHALISAFVDQVKPVSPAIVEEVARDFTLNEIEPTAPPRRRLWSSRL